MSERMLESLGEVKKWDWEIGVKWKENLVRCYGEKMCEGNGRKGKKNVD